MSTNINIYQLKALKVNGQTIDGISFTMPAENVTVSAEFELVPVYTFSVSPLLLDFGVIAEGQALPAPQTVTIINTGNAEMNINCALTGSGFNFTFTDSTLPVGGRAYATVFPEGTFTPGVYEGTLTIARAEGTGRDAVMETVQLKLTVTEQPDIPQTGDESMPIVWLLLLMGAALLLPKRKLV